MYLSTDRVTVTEETPDKAIFSVKTTASDIINKIRKEVKRQKLKFKNVKNMNANKITITARRL